MHQSWRRLSRRRFILWEYRERDEKVNSRGEHVTATGLRAENAGSFAEASGGVFAGVVVNRGGIWGFLLPPAGAESGAGALLAAAMHEVREAGGDGDCGTG